VADEFSNLSEDARAYLRKLHNDYNNVKKTDSGMAEKLMETQRKAATRQKKSSSDYARGMGPKSNFKEKPRDTNLNEIPSSQVKKEQEQAKKDNKSGERTMGRSAPRKPKGINFGKSNQPPARYPNNG
jgi:hypothetical protein